MADPVMLTVLGIGLSARAVAVLAVLCSGAGGFFVGKNYRSASNSNLREELGKQNHSSAEMSMMISSLQKRLRRKNAEVREQKATIEKLNETIHACMEEATRSCEWVEKIQTKISHYAAQIEQLTEEVRLKEMENEALKERIQALECRRSS